GNCTDVSGSKSAGDSSAPPPQREDRSAGPLASVFLEGLSGCRRVQRCSQLIERTAAGQGWPAGGAESEMLEETQRKLCAAPLVLIDGPRPPTSPSAHFRRLRNRREAIAEAAPLVIASGKILKRGFRPRVCVLPFFQQMRPGIRLHDLRRVAEGVR